MVYTVMGAGGGSFVRLRCCFYLSSGFGETAIYAYYTLLLLSFRSSENVHLPFPLLAIAHTHLNHLHRLQHRLQHHPKCAGSTSPPSPADRAAPPSPNCPSPPRTPSSRTPTPTPTPTTPAKPANTSASPCPRTRATPRCTATAPSAPPLPRRLPLHRLLPARRGTGARSGRRGGRGGTGL